MIYSIMLSYVISYYFILCILRWGAGPRLRGARRWVRTNSRRLRSRSALVGGPSKRGAQPPVAAESSANGAETDFLSVADCVTSGDIISVTA